mmetsp:Transcript_71301/g.119342  ORF Transcript_71301/g.119342 Transcript_71301/m.119342 type:complete len:501 (-) Transcript_71301:394-1896(-)
MRPFLPPPPPLPASFTLHGTDGPVLDQVIIQRPNILLDFHGIRAGVHHQLQPGLVHAAQIPQQPPFTVRVVLRKELRHRRGIHHHPLGLGRAAVQVRGQVRIVREVGQNRGGPRGLEAVHALQEGLGRLRVRRSPVALERGEREVLQRGDAPGLLRRRDGLRRPGQHVGVEVLRQHHRLLPEHVPRDRHVPRGGEGDGLDQALLHQLQPHRPLVHRLEVGAVALHEVDLDAVRQVVLQALQEGPVARPVPDRLQQPVQLVKACVHEVRPQDPQRILLLLHGLVQKPGMHQHTHGRRVGLQLELQPHPTVTFVVLPVLLGHDGVGKREEARVGALGAEGLLQFLVLCIDHLLQSLQRHESVAVAVEGVAHGHVVGRDCFRDGAGRSADVEKDTPHLLPGADLRDAAVGARVQIDLQRLVQRPLGDVARRRRHGPLVQGPNELRHRARLAQAARVPHDRRRRSQCPGAQQCGKPHVPGLISAHRDLRTLVVSDFALVVRRRF